jgi:hypothetical protein
LTSHAELGSVSGDHFAGKSGNKGWSGHLCFDKHQD